MITLTLQLTVSELAAVAAALEKVGVVPKVADVEVRLPAEDKPAKKSKPAHVATAETPPVTAPTETAPAESVSEITLEQVRAKLGELTQAGKRAEVKALLEKRGAAKLTDLPTDVYADVLAEAEAL